MFALRCQKKFQVVQSVTALFDLPGRGRARVCPSLQVGGRTRRDSLWRATAAGQQGKRSTEPACFARSGRCRCRGEQPEGSEPRAKPDTAEGSGSPSKPHQDRKQAGRGNGQAPATLQPATCFARAFEAKPAQLHAERKGRADTLG